MPRSSSRGPCGRAGLCASLVGLSLIALALFAAPALAATVTSHPLLPFSPITGSGTGVTLHDPAGIAVDEASGNVFLNDGRVFNGTGGNVTDIFGAEGGAPSGVVSPYQITGFSFGPNVTDVAVDNSATSPSKGALYVVDNGVNAVKKFARNAATEHYEAAGQLVVTSGPSFESPLGVAVDSHGNVFVADYNSQSVIEFSPTGTQLARIGTSASVEQPASLALDNAGDLFVEGANTGSVYEYPANGSGQVEEAVFTQIVGSGATGVAVDSGANVLYIAFGDHVNQYDASTLALQGAFGDGVLGATERLAVNSTTGNIYVSDRGKTEVAAFGPTLTGTVPDSTIETTTEVGINKAKFNGTVNPQGVPSSYHFQWKEGTGSSWGNAQTSPSQSLPADSIDHAVSFNATGLSGNTTYQVRLVGVNTSNNLTLASGADTFTTAIAAAPTATVEPASPVGATTAVLHAQVNPQGDTGSTYRFQTSTDPACELGFSEQPLRRLESGATNPVAVSEELTGLLPSQHYCVRIEVENSGGAILEPEPPEPPVEFTTLTVPPDQVSTAFAAPRTATTARINARVNPEGVPFTYHFEYSEDGGETWIPLADHEDTSNARGPIVVAAELGQLRPGTTYEYRFFAGNTAGEASPQGGTKTFTTRTDAEMALPPNAFGEPERRGIELVNSPDKGNQNVLIPRLRTHESTVGPNGEEALWSAAGGAPGGSNGSQAIFLAERTAGGWSSRGLAPPASQQVGGGGLSYFADAATADLSRFIFDAEQATPLFEPGEATWVRLDAHQNQEILRTYKWTEPEGRPAGLDMTEDGSHVLAVAGDTKQLEDLGGSTPEVVSLMPDGTQSSCGLDLGSGASFVGGANTGNSRAAGVSWRAGYHMIDTTDASLVYFEAKPNGECPAPWGLYVRDRAAGETSLIDPGTDGNDVAFIRATPNGRNAYFATHSRCRKWSQGGIPTCVVEEEADANEDVDVYRWDEESKESTCLTCVVADAAIEGEQGQYTPIMVSDDFSHVYFESSKQLVADQGTPGKRSLYVLSDGTVRLVGETNRANTTATALDEAELSRDGSVLLFQTESGRDLTADEVAAEAQELYLYDDRDGSLECISCLHGGVTTQEDEGGGGQAGSLQMSSDGSTVAFSTAQALVSPDVNRGPDLYEWRNGAIRLITDGVTEFKTGLAAPAVEGMDPSGANIFFSVADPGLTGFEQDGLANFYDARIGGGFELPPQPTHCEGDACQGPLQAAPNVGQPGSTSFSGPGNQSTHPKRRPCAHKRGVARRRCAKKHKMHSHSNKANHTSGRGR